MRIIVLVALAALLLLGMPAINAQTPGELMAAITFASRLRAARTLSDVHTLADWQARRATYRQ